jgi:hypothetical protein
MLTAEGLKIQKNGWKGEGAGANGRWLIDPPDTSGVPRRSGGEDEGNAQDAGDEDVNGGYLDAKHLEGEGAGQG